MPDIAYPSSFHQKVLAQEAPGGEPASVTLVAPTVLEPRETFDLRVAVLDQDGYPSVECDTNVVVRGPGGSFEATFERQRPAVAAVKGARFDRPGFHRLEAELNGEVFFSNPVRVEAKPAERVYWGDPHVHTVLSRCHTENCRSLNFCFTAARHVTGLDWVTAADHVSNGRCDFAKWREQSLTSDLYDDSPDFVTLPGYEASLKGGCGGDNNVYTLRWPDMFVDEHDEGNAKTLCEKLAEKLDPSEFFIVPHHTTRTGKHGEIPESIYPGLELMPLVEIHSKWGTSEYRGNPNPLVKVHDGPCYAVDLLNQGLPLGFIGGTDTHATMPSGFGIEPATGHLHTLPGFTAARAKTLSRPSLFEALRTRNCYATSLERIYLDVTIAGRRSGEIVKEADLSIPREIAIAVAGKSDIEKVEVVRNGKMVQTFEPGGWHAQLSYVDTEDARALTLPSKHIGDFVYYYVRVTCASGAQAWSSPVWLLG